MITVRFPSGFSVQYNDLDNADIRADGIYLGKNKSPGTYSVWVPKDCLVEHLSPCRTYNASGPSSNLVAEVTQLTREIASLKRKLAKVTA